MEDHYERRIYPVDVGSGGGKFKLAPLVASAGTRWVFRVRFDARNEIVMTDKNMVCEIVSETKSEKLPVSYSTTGKELAALIDEQKDLYYGIKPNDGKKRKVLVWRNKEPLDEMVVLTTRDDGLITSATHNTRLALPYMIFCSLAPKTYIHKMEGEKRRLAHMYSPPDESVANICTIGDWMPVNQDYPEEVEVAVHIRSAKGTVVRHWHRNTVVTIELKQV